MFKRLQNHIAESRFSLLATTIVCLPAWVIAAMQVTGQSIQREVGIGFATIILTTYLMVEFNNTNSLIRIYSRMVSCSFLVMMTTLTFLYWSVEKNLITLCFIGFLFSIFHSYQNRQAAGWVYYAFCCLSIASLYFVQIFYFIPLLWILMSTRLLSMGLKTFCASLLGMLTPYWLLMAYKLWQGETDYLQTHFVEIAELESLLHLSMLNTNEIVTAAFILLCSFTGIVHIIRTKKQDRIRTQLQYEMMMVIDIFAIAFLLLQPQHYDKLIGIITVCTAPMIAHFIALTSTSWTNMMTKLLLLLAAAVTIFNLWDPLLNY